MKNYNMDQVRERLKEADIDETRGVDHAGEKAGADWAACNATSTELEIIESIRRKKWLHTWDYLASTCGTIRVLADERGLLDEADRSYGVLLRADLMNIYARGFIQGAVEVWNKLQESSADAPGQASCERD